MSRVAHLKLAGALCWFASTGCAAFSPHQVASAPRVAPKLVRASEPPATAQPAAPALPECTSAPCLPPRQFVTSLCMGKYPGVAVALFAANSPWQRAYVRMREIDPYNTIGGPSSSEKLVFDEELIVLDSMGQTDPTKMSVSGSGSHHVLRLDGTCATVMQDEVTTVKPPTPGHAQLTWSHLDDNIQTALLADPGVKAAHDAQRASCKGASVLGANEKCQGASRNLTLAVVQALRHVSPPTPERVPVTGSETALVTR